MTSPNSVSLPVAKARMALWGWTFRPMALRGHIWVHMLHWQHTARASAASRGLVSFFVRIVWFFGNASLRKKSF